MSPTAGPPVDPGLLARFRTVGPRIAWTPAPVSKRAGRTRKGGATMARVAKLDDETAHVEERGGDLFAESCPVGALVVLLEWDRRGAAPVLTSLEAGSDPAFPNGALVARWDGARGGSSTLGAKDLVDLARFAMR